MRHERPAGAGRPDRWILATCPNCADVKVRIDEVFMIDTGSDDRESSFCFYCASCGQVIRKVVSPPVAAVLRSAQVRVITRPLELDERRAGPPLSHDDVLSFHEALNAPGWLDAFLRDDGAGG